MSLALVLIMINVFLSDCVYESKSVEINRNFLARIVENNSFQKGWTECIREIVSFCFKECPIVYEQKHIKKAQSRKRNSNFLKIHARCINPSKFFREILVNSYYKFV